jgi:divalent metal cation (Fe/Co/Zn/Cd) transporter
VTTEIEQRRALEQRGRRLQWATIAWNSAEILVTIGLGMAAQSLALIAFGLDSLVEVFASLVVIWHMTPSSADPQLRSNRALRLVGVSFAVLSAYLVAAALRALVVHEHPESSPAGIVYLLVTAVVMFGLARWKRRTGTALNSDAFQAEASMTFLDGWLASSILAALVLNLVLGWWWADPLAALFLGVFAAREGVSAWREGTDVDELDTAEPPQELANPSACVSSSATRTP